MLPPQNDLHPGTIVDGRFEILSELGSGSFGTVYRARQLTTAQVVALKVLRLPSGADEPAERQTTLERFRREIRLCAELSHPNLVGLVDSGTLADVGPYVVFAYVAGHTLADVLANEGALAPREAVRLMGQVLDALAAAHRAQIVHRDIKPANIMVGGTGALRNATLLDLGLGGFLEGRRREARRLTATLEFAGTLAYAAPEQLFGAVPSAKSDLYSWGLVLFECLTGEHAFAREVLADALMEQRSVRLPQALADHPIGALLARVLEPDPLARDVDAGSLMRDLERLDAPTLATRLNARGPRAETETRRHITVVSCRVDVATESFEQSHRALQLTHDACEEIARRYSGVVGSKLGDRVVLYFGYPVAHENDARRAARAALEVVHECRSRAEDIGLRELSAHVSIHTGPMIARGDAESASSRPVELVGTVTAIAAKLDELAPTGQVVVTETVQRQIGNSLECIPFGSHSLRGESRPLVLFTLRAWAPSPLSSRAGQPAFVGRARQLRQLIEIWRDAEAGQAACVVLRGEAGIGKSRLRSELRDRVVQADWLECRCLEEYGNSPLSPIVTLLQERDTDPRELLERAGVDPTSSIPLLRNLLGLPPDPAYPRQALSAEREKALLLLSLTEGLIGLARGRRVILVIEDLHWADATTRELVRLLADRIANLPRCPLLLLLTTRDWTPDGASVIQLAPLSEHEVAQMVRNQARSRQLPPDLTRQIVERSDGVPLFVEEITRVLSTTQGSTGALAPPLVPESLEALLLTRLDALSHHGRSVVQYAAVLGREFELGLLRRVVRESDSTLRMAIEELVGARILITRAAGSTEVYGFRHALLRDAALQSMALSSRQASHARVAQQLELDDPGIAEAESERLAHHLAHAGSYERAGRLWLAAGRRLLASAAYTEAIGCLQMGLDVLPSLVDLRNRRQLEVELLETLGMGYYSTLGYGDERVEETFARAERACEQLGDGVPLQTLYGIWSVRLLGGRVAETEALIARLSTLAERSSDPLAGMYVHGCRGLRATLLGHLPEADAELELSTRECEKHAGSDYLARLPYGGAVYPPAYLAWVRLMRGQVASAQQSLSRMQTVAERIDKAYGHALAGHYRALFAVEVDDPETTLRLSQRQIAFSSEQQILLWQLCSQVLHGWALARLGNARDGVEEITHAMDVLGRIGLVSAKSALHAFRAEAELLAGDPDAADRSVQAGLDLARSSLDRFYRSPLYRVRAKVELSRGDRESAAGCLHTAIEIARAQGAGGFELRAALELSRLLADSGQRADGRALLARALANTDGGADLGPYEHARNWLADPA